MIDTHNPAHMVVLLSVMLFCAWMGYWCGKPEEEKWDDFFSQLGPPLFLLTVLCTIGVQLFRLVVTSL